MHFVSVTPWASQAQVVLHFWGAWRVSYTTLIVYQLLMLWLLPYLLVSTFLCPFPSQSQGAAYTCADIHSCDFNWYNAPVVRWLQVHWSEINVIPHSLCHVSCCRDGAPVGRSHRTQRISCQTRQAKKQNSKMLVFCRDAVRLHRLSSTLTQSCHAWGCKWSVKFWWILRNFQTFFQGKFHYSF